MVFHCAAITPTRENDKNKALMHAVNVGGTRNVIAACQEHGVGRLVFTSSSSVVFEGRDLVNVDENLPYAARPMDYYRWGWCREVGGVGRGQGWQGEGRIS